MAEIQETELHDIVVELRLLRAEFEHITTQNQATSGMLTEVFNRLRDLESSIAVLRATRPARANVWAIAAVIISGVVALITFVNEVSAPTL